MPWCRWILSRAMWRLEPVSQAGPSPCCPLPSCTAMCMAPHSIPRSLPGGCGETSTSSPPPASSRGARLRGTQLGPLYTTFSPLCTKSTVRSACLWCCASESEVCQLPPSTECTLSSMPLAGAQQGLALPLQTCTCCSCPGMAGKTFYLVKRTRCAGYHGPGVNTNRTLTGLAHHAWPICQAK